MNKDNRVGTGLGHRFALISISIFILPVSILAQPLSPSGNPSARGNKCYQMAGMDANDNVTTSDPMCCSPVTGSTGLQEPALHELSELDSAWQTDDGKVIQLKELKGRLCIVSMFYSTCQGVCLRTLQDLQSIEASLPAETRNHVNFVLVTLDPEADTRDVLHAYRVTEGLCSGHWTLLRGSKNDTRELAIRLRVLYGMDDAGRFIHTTRLVLVDADGRVASNSDGFSNLDAIVGLIKKKVQAMAFSSAEPAASLASNSLR